MVSKLAVRDMLPDGSLSHHTLLQRVWVCGCVGVWVCGCAAEGSSLSGVLPEGQTEAGEPPHYQGE